VIYVPSFVKIDSSIQKLIGGVTQTTARYKRYRGNEYTRNNRRIVGRVVFNVVRVVSRKVGD
jgi:hypothetical protein